MVRSSDFISLDAKAAQPRFLPVLARCTRGLALGLQEVGSVSTPRVP